MAEEKKLQFDPKQAEVRRGMLPGFASQSNLEARVEEVAMGGGAAAEAAIGNKDIFNVLVSVAQHHSHSFMTAAELIKGTTSSADFYTDNDKEPIEGIVAGIF